VTEPSCRSDHPYGVLIEEAAQRWLPQLNAEWQQAVERWERAGCPDHDAGSIVLGGWGPGLDRPAVRNPVKAAVEEANRRLVEACRRKFVACEWIATAKKHNPASVREEIEGDFFLDAQIAFDGTGYASAGRRKSKVEIFGLRVRRAVDMRREDGTSGTQPGLREVVMARPPSPEPTYTSPHSFSPEEVPDQFMKWAKEQHRLGNTITQGDAMAAMADEFGVWPAGPGQKTVIAWCKTLDRSWTAKVGTPPGRRRS
jgi:hypothetical protein